MSTFINTVDVLGDEAVVDSLIDRSIAEYFENRLTTVGVAAFQNCAALESVDLPKVTTVGNYGFKDCTALAQINLPELVTLAGAEVFSGCTNLSKADFPKLVGAISSKAFALCSNLTALIMRDTETVVQLSSTGAFGNTPIASGTGYIYVPGTLVDSYKISTNWSSYADQIRALEEYTVDGTVTGELDTSKI